MKKKINLTETELTRLIEKVIKEQEKTSSVMFLNVELADGSMGTITLNELDRLATEVGYKK
jgi:hypothetical protein